MTGSLCRSRISRVVISGMLATLFSVAQAPAAEFKPIKPINVVVPYAPGGGSDVFARAISNVIKNEKLSPKELVITNQPGGSATIGTTAVARSSGNDHMLLTFISGQITGPLIVGKNAATYRELTLVANLALDEQVIVVKTDSPFKTIQDVVAAAKKQTLSIGGTATGQEDQLCNHLFEKAAGIKLRYFSFNSGGECVSALLGGQVNMIWANPSEFKSQYEAKLVKPLAVAKETRIPLLKDVPTFKESGYHFVFHFFRGIAAPPKIAPEVLSYYETLMRRVSELPAWKDKYLGQHMLSPYFLGSRDFGQFVAKNEALFADALKELGLLK
ncbi:MAG: tripartite tricarboxylate transporter substrate binding protein [Deltaproteobacteria bacterium]|nr:tripartite tricarboxylate transporter substrate binding protein [Deltaproteobacteria bacterium]